MTTSIKLLRLWHISLRVIVNNLMIKILMARYWESWEMITNIKNIMRRELSTRGNNHIDVIFVLMKELFPLSPFTYSLGLAAPSTWHWM